MDEITISGRTVEEALEAGLEALSAERSEVDVQVVDEGVKGILGLLGTRLARVRVVRKSAVSRGSAPVAAKPEVQPSPVAGREESPSWAGERREEVRPAPSGARREPPVYLPAKPEQVERASTFLDGLCRLLGVEGEVVTREVDGAVRLSVEGDQMGLLIGRRGQTLDALQYLTGLVGNKGANNLARFVVDVEGYRDRREATLRRLAEHMSEKVKDRGHRAVLEPMSPQERRVIHMALADDPEVYTYSEGEEPYRRVIIALREDASGEDPGRDEE